MAAKDDLRAGMLLLALAAAGLVVRVVSGGSAAPGAVLYRPGASDTSSRDSLAAQAARLARPLSAGERIDPDRASVQELTRLPRIGPALAVRIVEEREVNGPFGSLEALDAVPGIGPSVLNGLKEYVAFSGPERAGRQGQHPARVRVTLSTATAEELTQLPGIGPSRAEAIIQFRRQHGKFKSVDELNRVSGIGPATVERIRKYVVP